MFNRLSWFLAYRYLNSKYTNGFISFITMVAMVGVALGTAILIIVLSVLNGFKTHIESILLQEQPHVIVEVHNSDNLSSMLENVAKISKEMGINTKQLTLIKDNGLIKVKNTIMPINIISPKQAIDYPVEPQLQQPQGVAKNSKLKTQPKKLSNTDTIAVSKALAVKLNLHLYDKIILAAPILKSSIIGPQPRFKRFTIDKIMDNHGNLSLYRDADVIMPYNAALMFFDLPQDYISGLYIYLDKPLRAEELRQGIIKNKEINSLFKTMPKVSTWYDYNRTLFQAIKMERTAIVVLLLIIIAVAGFNLISGLYIQVSEKQKDMAILRTYGLNRQQVSMIFIIQGIIIGLIGSLFGVLLGVIISFNLDYIFATFIKFNLINTDNLFFTSIADRLIKIAPNYLDVTIIALSAIIICVLATILPAFRASKILPIEALRHE